MTRSKFCLWIAVTIAIPAAYSAAQAGIGATSGPPRPTQAPAAPATPAATTVVPPEHPATVATLRRYFEVCHFAVRNRQALEAQFAVQQKTLPAWYPADLWSETVEAVRNVDVVEVAIPVYQKYYSEDATQNAIRLFVTPQGQAMVNKVYEKTIEQVSAGDSVTEARKKVLAEERATEDADIRQMFKSMTPEQERETATFVQTAEWKHMNAISDQVFQDFIATYLARQKEAMRAVALQHQTELRQALQDYKAAHPGYEP